MSELRESMWDLVYGLLSEEESQVIIARIKSEPDAARMYAEVRLEAELVAQAARVEDSSVALKADQDMTAVETSTKAMPAPARGGSARVGAELHRGEAGLAGIAAAALALLLACGLSWQRTNKPQLARAFVAADVFASQPMLAGLTCPVELRTYDLNSNGEPAEGAPANVELRLVDSTGNPRFSKAVLTNEIGHTTCDLPGEALESGVRLEVAASKETQSPMARRSDQVARRAEANSNNGLAASVELPVQPEPQIAYFLCASPVQQLDQQVPYAEWYFNAFTAKPAPPEAAQNALAAVQAANEPRPAALPAAEAANGTVRFQNLERMSQLRGPNDKVAAGEAAKNFKSQAVVPPNQPIIVAVPEQLEGKPLKVTAMNRGVPVASQVVNSAARSERKGRTQAGPANKTDFAQEQLSLTLPPEADGLVEVQLFDESKKQQEPVDRQYVVRQPTRRLRIDVPDAKARYSPGEQVALTVRCTDEKGKPAADTRLGVRVWNENAIRQSGEEPVLLADAVDQGLGDIIENPVAPAQQAAAPAQQRGQLGRRLTEETTVDQQIELATNRDVVKSALRAAAGSAEMARERAISVFGGAAIVGGIGLLLLLTMLAALRLSIGWRTMAPGFVVAIASLLIGLGWIGWMPGVWVTGDIALAPAAPAKSAVAHSSSTDDVSRLDMAALESSVRERDERARASAEAAPALASNPAPIPADAPIPPAAPQAAAPLAESAAPMAKELMRAEAGAAPVAMPPVSQKLDQGGRAIVTLQVPGGQQSRAFNLAKDSEVESINRRIAGAAGGFGAAAGGRGQAGPPAGALAEDLKQKSVADEAKKEPLADVTVGKPQAAAAPASLYFNPQLMTDSEGKATFQFTMPQADSQYRLLVDALGQGRIGSRQQTIVVGDAPSK